MTVIERQEKILELALETAVIDVRYALQGGRVKLVEGNRGWSGPYDVKEYLKMAEEKLVAAGTIQAIQRA